MFLLLIRCLLLLPLFAEGLCFSLVNVYVDLVIFTRIAGTLKTGSGRYWP